MLSSTRSRALLAAVITVLLVTALVIYILYGEKKPQPIGVRTNASSLSQDNFGFEGSGDIPDTTTTLENQLPLLNEDEVDTSTGSTLDSTISIDSTISSDSTTSSTTEPLSTTVSPTEFTPVDDETKAGLPQCSSILMTKKPKCEIENQPPRASYEKWSQWDTRNGSIDLIGDIQPIHYDVNVSISNADSRLLKASAEIFVRVSTKTSSIPLHLDRTVINLNASSIFVRNCQTGEFICVKSIAQLVEKQLVVLVLSTEVAESSLISIYFESFDVQIYSNPGLVLQSPSKWETQRAWILGSLFDDVGARSVFPSIDQPSAKASWRLCCQYPSNLTSRSNMPSETVIEKDANSIQNCFQTSPALRPDNFAFVIFENLLAIHSDTKDPAIEVFVGKHLKAADSKWIVLEVQDALKKMAELTGIGYPLSKLSIVSMPLPIDGTHSYGLISVKESWIEYPKYLLTHTILNRQVVQQWISNMFTICDKCIQEGLAIYLEWLVSAESEHVKLSSKDRALEAKQTLLSYGNDRSTPLRSIIIEPSKNEDECVSRSAIILAMIDEAFGIEATKRFIHAIAESNTWGKCVATKEISDMLLDTTLSPVSQQIFESFGTSKNYPILRLNLDDKYLNISSESSNKKEPHLFTVTYSVLNEQGKPTNLISNGSDAVYEAPGQTVIINPTGSGFFRAIYDIENYKRLVECSTGNQCAKLTKESFENMYTDLCWALLSNRLDSSNPSASAWHQLFGQITSNNLVQGDCNCCMQGRSQANAHCKWIWKDKCSNLDLKNDQ